MCNREEVLEVISDYVGELKSSNRCYCMTPYKQNTCEGNCEECSEKYWDRYQEELERKCGVSNEP